MAPSRTVCAHCSRWGGRGCEWASQHKTAAAATTATATATTTTTVDNSRFSEGRKACHGRSGKAKPNFMKLPTSHPLVCSASLWTEMHGPLGYKHRVQTSSHIPREWYTLTDPVGNARTPSTTNKKQGKLFQAILSYLRAGAFYTTFSITTRLPNFLSSC